MTKKSHQIDALQSQTQLSQLEKKATFSQCHPVTTIHLKMHITVVIIAQKNSNKTKVPCHWTVQHFKLLPERDQPGIRFTDKITCDGN